MPVLPAHCDNCDLTFRPMNIRVDNSTNITFAGGTITCPRCRRRLDSSKARSTSATT